MTCSLHSPSCGCLASCCIHPLILLAPHLYLICDRHGLIFLSPHLSLPSNLLVLDCLANRLDCEYKSILLCYRSMLADYLICILGHLLFNCVLIVCSVNDTVSGSELIQLGHLLLYVHLVRAPCFIASALHLKHLLLFNSLFSSCESFFLHFDSLLVLICSS